jgi:hypothetical protein
MRARTQLAGTKADKPWSLEGSPPLGSGSQAAEHNQPTNSYPTLLAVQSMGSTTGAKIVSAKRRRGGARQRFIPR